ncbi:MAG: toll/interleukin-1 receptor domain-containing protein [Anaerolineae bacterium]|nr:toll/interleukin-1 receptor domain-containing protein [Anaerolineae bacterium]
MTSSSRIFISYARKDGRDLALRLQKSLSDLRYDVWLDTNEIEGGASWTKEIEEGINNCDILLALLSKKSYESEICRSEHLRAIRLGKRIIPILVQPKTDRPIYLEGANYVNFAKPTVYSDAFTALMQTLSNDTAPKIVY